MGDYLPTKRVHDFIEQCVEKPGFKDKEKKEQTFYRCYRNWYLKTHPDKGGNEYEFKSYSINDLFSDNATIYSKSGEKNINDLRKLHIDDPFFKNLTINPNTGRQQSSRHTTT